MALTLVSGRMLANGSISADKLVAGAIVAPAGALADNSVFANTIADGAVMANNILDYTITSNKLANGVTVTISANSITSNEIVNGGVQANNIATGAALENLGANSITALQLEDDSVIQNVIKDSAVTTAKINDDAVTTGKIASTIVIESLSAEIINTKSSSTKAVDLGLSYDTYNSTINVATGGYFISNTTDATTWTFTGTQYIANSNSVGFILELTSGGGNTSTAYTQTWPASVKWPSETAPTLTQGETFTDVLVFLTRDGGTTWRGALSMANSA